MSNSGGDKTEKATPKRRKQSRDEGQVTKSQDLSAASVLIVSFVILLVAGPFMYSKIEEIAVSTFSNLNYDEINLEGAIPYFFKLVIDVGIILAPILIAIVVIAIIINLVQVGPMFSPKAIKPNLKKVNPLSGFKRLFSLRSLVELVKGISKIVIVGAVCYFTIMSFKNQIMALSGLDLISSGKIIYEIIYSISWKVCIILLVLGLLDFFYQKYEFEKSIKMSKQEVKDEHKNIEGNPEIKRKIKSIQMQMAQQRMMGKVPEADVVVTNPTHFAVALKYDPKVAPAPIVVAKGADHLALRIKKVAKENKVPIVENKPLARSLYKLADIKTMVPEELFVAVAEVLAYVYKKNKGKKGKIKVTS